MNRREALGRIALLMGGTVSAPVVSGILAGCRGTSGGAYTPQTLTAEQYDLTGLLADVILPPTDTPGAREAGVPEFVDKLMTDWYPPEDQQRFTDGLANIDGFAQSAFEKPFADLSGEEQAQLVAVLDREAYRQGQEEDEEEQGEQASALQQGTDALERIRENQVADQDPDTPPFFRMMKELTISGYYTSEIGATQELHENPMGAYLGDVAYAEIGKAWA